MENEIKYAFIASPKVIRYKLGNNAADVLATLIYKYKHFKSKNQLVSHKGYMCFYVSYSDIIEETSFKHHTVKKSIVTLKKHGLIVSIQQGLNKPNYYSVDEKLIDKYIEDHQDDYEDWRLEVRAKNKPVTPINSLMELKQLLRKDSDNFQEGTQTTTTKNKITKNKITKNNFTNRINADIKNLDLSNYADKLEKMIDDIKEASNNETKKVLIMKLFDFLCEIIPRFKNYSISEKDYEMIYAIGGYIGHSFLIADKILNNAKAIIDGSKTRRFGNLFIGLKEINDNTEFRYN